MTLKVRVTGPNKSGTMQVDMALFNQAQMKQVTFERDNWREM